MICNQWSIYFLTSKLFIIPLVGFVCFGTTILITNAQLANVETYKNRKLGAPPKAIEAAINGDMKTLRTLWLNQRMHIFVRDQQQRTVLMTAIIYDHLDIAQFTLANQVDVLAFDKYGNSALHYAAFTGNTDAMSLLMKYHANINMQNFNGETPLMLSIKSECIDAVNYLLNKGADVKIIDFTARRAQDYVAMTKSPTFKRQVLALKLNF